MNNNLLALDACSLGEAFRRAEARPQDLLEACLRQIHKLDSGLCVFNTLLPYKQLRRQAEQAYLRYSRGAPLSPLDGVPFAVKANIAIRRCPWHAGIAALASRQAAADSAAVATLRGAGMIPIGIVNMHEAALGVTTDNWAFGRTLNPRNPEHIPGGSSGGSAAAVAAGMVPIALGTDDMGSVRLPSAFCGIIGYKPGFGTIPVDGLIPLTPRLDHIGVHARSIADVRAVMRLFGEDVEESIEPPAFATCQLPSTLSIEPSVALAFQALIDRLNISASINWQDVDLSAWRRAGLLLCERDAERTFAEPLDYCPEGFGSEFRAMIDWAKQVPSEKFERAENLITDAGNHLRRDLGDRLLLSPTAPITAPRIDGEVPNDVPNLTVPANFAGIPSISVPMPDAESALPVGLQITGLQASEVLTAAESLCPGTVPATAS